MKKTSKLRKYYNKNKTKKIMKEENDTIKGFFTIKGGKNTPRKKNKKPTELKSISHKIQLNEDCGFHSISRSICRSFQVITIIDGDSIEVFYTIIYLMIIKLFNIDCDVGTTTHYVPSMINTILNELYKYAKNENSDLTKYKYSDIPCKYIINNDNNELCNVSHRKILDDLSNETKDSFKHIFIKVYDIHAFEIKCYNYKFSNNNNNYPDIGIVKLLEKKLQPCASVECLSHAVVLRSWGIEYDEDGETKKVNNNHFCYTNTWHSEYKKCYNDISDLCNHYITDNKKEFIYFCCLDYDENKIKDKYKDLYDNIIKRRNLFFVTINIDKNNINNINSEIKINIYEGEWKNGIPYGNGKMIYTTGDIYEGEWINGVHNGKGKIIYENRDIYEGGWMDGYMIEGKMIYENGDVYEGEFINGLPNVNGKMIYKNGDVYEGDIIDGSPNGKGKMIYENGSIYEGEIIDGLPNGKGKMIYENSSIYEGEFIDKVPYGKGKIVYKDGSTYEGDLIQGSPRGKGKMIYKNGNIYEGDIIYGYPHGIGKMIYENGIIYEGKWKKGIHYIGN
jgi:hypothetical protein